MNVIRIIVNFIVEFVETIVYLIALGERPKKYTIRIWLWLILSILIYVVCEYIEIKKNLSVSISSIFLILELIVILSLVMIFLIKTKDKKIIKKGIISVVQIVAIIIAAILILHWLEMFL